MNALQRRCAREAVRDYVPRAVYESLCLTLVLFVFVAGFGGVEGARAAGIAIMGGLGNASIWALAASMWLYVTHRRPS